MLPQGGACELDIVVQVDFGQIMMALGGKSSAFGKENSISKVGAEVGDMVCI